MLSELLQDPYYALGYPKSTGKELFNHTYLLPTLKKYSHLPMPDIVATLTELTAVTVSSELNKFGIDSVYVSGGGIHNKTMMQSLLDKSPSIEFLPYEELGLNSDGKEAFIFALIGFLSTHNQPGNIPSSTGANGPRILGDLTPGKSGFPIPKVAAEALTRLKIISR
jgi:anhydro-N-acetylmuramic acid kinase